MANEHWGEHKKSIHNRDSRLNLTITKLLLLLLLLSFFFMQQEYTTSVTAIKLNSIIQYIMDYIFNQ